MGVLCIRISLSLVKSKCVCVHTRAGLFKPGWVPRSEALSLHVMMDIIEGKHSLLVAICLCCIGHKWMKRKYSPYVSVHPRYAVR